MRLLVMGVLCFSNYKILTKETIKNKITPLSICEEDYECELPYRCCDGIFFNYCCFHGGTPAPIPIPIPFPTPDPKSFPSTN